VNGRSQTVDADDWINHPRAKEYQIREHSIPAGEAVLMLLWWKDTEVLERFVGRSRSVQSTPWVRPLRPASLRLSARQRRGASSAMTRTMPRTSTASEEER
jgi:hypothetical protein